MPIQVVRYHIERPHDRKCHDVKRHGYDIGGHRDDVCYRLHFVFMVPNPCIADRRFANAVWL